MASFITMASRSDCRLLDSFDAEDFAAGGG
jgi:hypothetical protein